MSSYFNKLSGFIFLSIFFILFILTIYSLISSNEIIRNAELVQYVFIADIIFLLILLLYLILFLINYIKNKKRDIVGLRLFNKFFLFFGIFSIIPSGIMLLSSAIFFNIELSTWLGPAFKSSVNNSYQLAQKYIDQTERNLITDSKFIRNYVLAERLIDRDIIERFDIATVYNVIRETPFIEYFTEENNYELSSENLERTKAVTKDDITIFFYDQQLFSKINLSNERYLILLKSIDLETLNYYQNIINSYNAINSIDNDKKNIQITFFTIYTVLSISLIIIFIIIGTNFSFRLARPIRSLNSAIISLKKGNFQDSDIKKTKEKDDISQLTNSFYDMSKTISAQRINLQETNNTVNDQLQFINNIIKNSPYGIFVIHNKELIFQNEASNIFKNDEKSSFSFIKDKIINDLRNKNKDFESSFEINLNLNIQNIQKIFFIKSIYLSNNSLYDQIIIFNDYTDLIAAEKNNAIADLARKISHEIKNPLTPMLLSSEFLESQLEDEDLKNSVISIKRQIFLIQNLVNEFSSYARLPKPKFIKLNISDICNIYIDEYKKNYPNINFNSKIDNNLTFNFDQSYIDIILNNLFKNSIEALHGTKTPQIELILSIDKKNIKLVFFDNGPGYDGDISDLLKPYFSTKNSSGLGLSLINKIINENSGDLIIKTNKYSGFKVEIMFNV